MRQVAQLSCQRQPVAVGQVIVYDRDTDRRVAGCSEAFACGRGDRDRCYVWLRHQKALKVGALHQIRVDDQYAYGAGW